MCLHAEVCALVEPLHASRRSGTQAWQSSLVHQKSLSFICHSGLDLESSISELDSRFRGNDGFGINVKKR
jgi:hypothetical protein